jgi:hypothetical protein
VLRNSPFSSFDPVTILRRALSKAHNRPGWQLGMAGSVVELELLLRASLRLPLRFRFALTCGPDLGSLPNDSSSSIRESTLGVTRLLFPYVYVCPGS